MQCSPSDCQLQSVFGQNEYREPLASRYASAQVMNRVLFIVLGDPGHLNPLLAVAQHAADSGAELAFFCRDDIAERLYSAGLSPALCRTQAIPKRSMDSARFGARLSDARWMSGFLHMVLISRSAELVPAVREVIREFDPEVVCVDAMAYEGAIAATKEERPWVGISTNLIPVVPPTWKLDYLDVFHTLEPARTELCDNADVELSFHVSDVVSPWLNITFTIEELAPPGERYSFLVGPARCPHARGDEPAFPWAQLPDDRPLVYLSFGTQIAHPLDFTLELLNVFASDDVHIVAALKDQLPGLPTPHPTHVTAVAYAPQLSLLERVAAMINHGGANSVTECLYSGKPQLVLPVAYDQHIQARVVQDSGAGATIAADQTTAEACRKLILSMLTPDASYRRSAQHISLALRARDGAVEACELIARLAANPEPMRPTQDD